MKRTTAFPSITAAFLAFGLTGSAAAEEARFDRLANLPFEQKPSHGRDCQGPEGRASLSAGDPAYIWALPLINTLGMRSGAEDVFGTGYNVMPVWKERLDTKTMVTTPNSDLIYAMAFIDMGETGPIVFEAPPKLQGILLDFWQRPIPMDGGKFFGDVRPARPRCGQRRHIRHHPPGYDGQLPEDCLHLPLGHNNLFVFLRAFYDDPDNLEPTNKLVNRSSSIPLNLPESERKPMQFPNASGVNATCCRLGYLGRSSS